MLPSIFAAFSVDDIRAYVNNERVSGVDTDGGDIKVKQEDVLEMAVKLNNDFNETTSIKLKGIISDIDGGSDMKKELDWSDVSAYDTKTKTLSFYIPSDSDIGSFELTLTLTHKNLNGTEITKTYDYNVIAAKKDAVAEVGQVDLAGSFNNLTGKFSIMVDKMDSCFGYVNNSASLRDEISTCKEERGTYKSSSDNCASDLSACRSEKTTLDTAKTNCENAKANMKTVEVCTQEKNDAVSIAKKDSQNMMLMIGAAAVIVWFFMKKKKQQSTVTGAYMEKGFL
jgi:hypothetical protein